MCVTEPFISVVMPVRNALPYLDAAVESILAQSHANFEFVIRDDDSTDGSRERLRYWASRDDRIRLFEGDACLGPAGSSNWVVAQARADIVARMDADDVSHPRRLQRELQVLTNHPGATLLGSVWEGIDSKGLVVREPDFSTVRSSGFAAPFAHGSIMFRRAAFEAVGGYRRECDFWEDLDLYIRMAGLGRVLVVAEPLYQHRFSETSTRLTSERERVEASVDLMLRCRAAHNRGENYTPLLHAPRIAGTKLDPFTFLSLGSITLWLGRRPWPLGTLMRHGRIGFDMASAQVLAWSAWATVSPGTLRQAMRLMLRLRSRKARAAMGRQPVFEWSVRGIPPTVPFGETGLPRPVQRRAQ
jgi:cellulose synthase/poly-beta-1,6-N-acetylglucosamine synthase-like glycosyltransferase